MSGRATGGKKFSRGQLYRILSNPIYRGQIVHHENRYAGLHDAIVSERLWAAVHEKLEANRQGIASGKGQKVSALLAGLIVDIDGQRLKSNHACKGKKRYRYYIGTKAPQSEYSAGGAAPRIPATELDSVVVRLVCDALDDPLSLLLKALVKLEGHVILNLEPRAQSLISVLQKRDYFTVRSLVEKVVAAPKEVLVQLSIPALAQCLGLPFNEATVEPVTLRAAVRVTRSGRGVHLVQRDGRSTNGNKPDIRLAQHLIQARKWWEQLETGAINIATIARNEKVNETWISSTVRLNFLAPDIVEALLSGTHPVKFGTDLLRRSCLPIDWKNQRDKFEFETDFKMLKQ